MTYDDATSVLNQVESFLKEKIELPLYGQNLFQFGGADVVKQTTESRLEERVGKPYVLISIESEKESQWSSANEKAYDLTIKADSTATDWSGAQVGLTNSESSQNLLSRALTKIVYEERNNLNNLGLELSRYEMSRQTTQTNSESGGETQTTEGKIYLTYWR